ncbi:MAG: uridine diphosphate-N-acetylglucosamine-binding protein YvcK [Candidatus Jettenia sp.]|uniref:Putative gluconeogenesis factor n=1 Tax=Candidatus Jettenia caeni TaxID=247490 RepID=I3IQH6_9BACT|nr:YvcK family protein [Candidatus Jettenia sp. AMX1]MBC6928598.1 uridine diphosphate-N-acetylglucosamine-binding protein YvcK [Candidatus Jettenia sp.]WKZ15282.1 MAG: uridine diphosphate-N-acetylglucosamine-binding protein YvcK [Candidatus Jettenia caeni]KAA0249855.1 MAG: uridine diphosphate-N-acetylglucosamine-binding protein YvcK [Candidatus Jettenia sp. AMX1]MCE7880617.1 uridine diphosphate-N-acetylglucosamine-binding protein YvcK [Candidatus Jettenia sp. AMX1]MCQ3927231.1 uridine diphosph
MKIKAVIFDLDDTLYDCTGLLIDASRKRAAKAMVEAGLPCTEEEAYQLQKELSDKYGPYHLVFNEIVNKYRANTTLINIAYKAYNSSEVSEIKPFPDVIPTLKELKDRGYYLFLLSVGVHERQENKINILGLRPYFDEIVINDQEIGPLMEDCIRNLIGRYTISPCETVMVGDKIRDELRIAKSLGMITIQMLHGRYKNEPSMNEYDRPHYKIKRIFQVPTILQLNNVGRTPDRLKIVAIGGGTGLPIMLEGSKTYSKHLTAVVTVTDSGRSSGVLREEFGILPPGDARNCLAALSETEEQERDLYQLFQYRFNKGSLEGMSLGNLLMAALTDITGSFEQAIKKASKILSIRGKVLPSTLTNTHICAELEDGTKVEEEFNVRALGKAPIKNVFLKTKDVTPLPEAVEEILKADIIVIGPGSLYTSLITNLLVSGIRNAIRDSKAKKIYICNIVTQPGQTDHYKVSDHINAVVKYLGDGVLDYVIVNNNIPRKDILDKYQKEGAELALMDEGVYNLNVNIKKADLIEDINQKRILWEKQDLIRHDPDKLADSICRVYANLPLLTIR